MARLSKESALGEVSPGEGFVFKNQLYRVAAGQNTVQATYTRVELQDGTGAPMLLPDSCVIVPILS